VTGIAILGVDFTSAPRRAKAITVARAWLADAQVTLHAIDRLETFAEFESLLNEPGPWVGGFDFPFGLPRALVAQLAWPQDWRTLTQHVVAIGKEAFKTSLNDVRQSRPVGAKYIPRRGDSAAGSSSPMKLVNPPVGLMFFEGAPRLATSGVCVIPNASSSDSRVALEAYPGFLARQLAADSYKKDGAEGNHPKRRAARETIMAILATHTEREFGLRMVVPPALAEGCVADGSGDSLDAVLCAVQAAASQRAYQLGDERFGIPRAADDFEGWIATVPS
jgi:hypothetical protein